MKLPRFQIGLIMVIVAAIAIDLGVLRVAMGHFTSTARMLAAGSLPMASILGISLFIHHRRPGFHPYLAGFQLFGSIAMVLYGLLAAFPANEALRPYVAFFVNPAAEAIGSDQSPFFISVVTLIEVVVLVLPQVVIAVVGGFLWRLHMIDRR